MKIRNYNLYKSTYQNIFTIEQTSLKINLQTYPPPYLDAFPNKTMFLSLSVIIQDTMQMSNKVKLWIPWQSLGFQKVIKVMLEKNCQIIWKETDRVNEKRWLIWHEWWHKRYIKIESSEWKFKRRVPENWGGFKCFFFFAKMIIILTIF